MALPFIPSDAGLLALQAAVVAAPRAVARPGWMERFRGRGWALVPIGSIVLVPLSSDGAFGDGFEVVCNVDEIFISTAQVSDIVMIPSNTAANLRIR